MGKFFKYALFVKELNNLDDLYNESPNVFHRVVAMKDINPNAAIGLAWKNSNGKQHIYIDPETALEKQRSIRRHELVHAIRNKKGLTTSKWATSEPYGFKKGISTFIEELAATRAGNYSRTMRNSPLGRKISNKYLYPIESGIGALTGKTTRFKILRRLLAK